MSKHDLALTALNKALQLRQKNNIGLPDATDIYHLAEQAGIQEIRFVDIPSLEELYWKDQKTILLSLHRPAGRRAFNCAHGLGHHVFGHGMCISSISSGGFDERFDPNEFLADTFAGFVLMPKTTVCHAFASRRWSIENCTPIQVYSIACWLGVGYTTLVHHMCRALNLISESQAVRLSAVPLSRIRFDVLGYECAANILVVDKWWSGRAVDLEVGDYLLLSDELQLEESRLKAIGPSRGGFVHLATEPGYDAGYIAITDANSAVAVRVYRKNYQGRNIFRFDNDPDYVQPIFQLY